VDDGTPSHRISARRASERPAPAPGHRGVDRAPLRWQDSCWVPPWRPAPWRSRASASSPTPCGCGASEPR